MRALKMCCCTVTPKISFEFFPPKTILGSDRLWQTIDRLATLNPQFLSVTYGAGGSTRKKTRDTVARIHRRTGLSVAAHLTCVGASRSEVMAVANSYLEAGVRHIVALRGDPPAGAGTRFTPHPKGFSNAADLVAGLKRVADFEISVAAHPEVHPDAGSAQADLDNIRAKVDAGADRLITQYFFGVDAFLRFRDRVRAAGIEVPLVPGIMPICNFGVLRRFSKACGATIPAWLKECFDNLDNDPEIRQLVAAAVATEQCKQLQAEGVDAFHFYTLNRAPLALAVCRRLGIRPACDSPAVPVGSANAGQGRAQA